MSLAEHLAAPMSPFPLRCGVAIALAELPTADVDVLTAALADPAYTGAQIARALRAEGHKVRDDSVRNHRRGDCNCGTR